MAPQVLNRVCYGSSPLPWQLESLTITPAILDRHCRHRVSGHDYPGLIPSHDVDDATSVRGTYVTGLTQGDIWRLDIFEGDEYARRKVKVRLLKDNPDSKEPSEKMVETETYLWVAGDHFLEKGEWDFSHFQKEKMQRWVCEYPSFSGTSFHTSLCLWGGWLYWGTNLEGYQMWTKRSSRRMAVVIRPGDGA